MPFGSPSLKESAKLRQTSLKNLELMVKNLSSMMDSTSAAVIFELLITLLKHSEQGQAALGLVYRIVHSIFHVDSLTTSDHLAKLSDAIISRLYDMEWDIRDATIDFVASLFSGNDDSSERRFTFGIQLIKPVINRCKDSEPSVRFKALWALQSMIKNNAAWTYMNTEGLILPLVRQCLEECLQDSEALVRRGAVDLLSTFVTILAFNPSLILSRESGADEWKLGESMLKKLVSDDSDWEVRICTLNFLFALLDRAFSQSDNELIDWVVNVKGDELLEKSTTDDSRLVRAESASIIAKLLPLLKQRPDCSIGRSSENGFKTS
ncbi:hypothetical protein BCR33DRAFT_496293 [Rhizoclosmatium globosum]|uniref:ARM repeat-containing protein n=1 Tax=Rhizoclosmatium globosum TaxID=329046 RepID=A0A1Y2CWU8_9FUNG|nr:hypothetical protein BCR33DRAFT_496293 [Rhizoclosmatium globosum]|eukprot:ORY50815.1 hypothetical protein BCR33DRAFT_496293 [Rhizoclosmatium globosum]